MCKEHKTDNVKNKHEGLNLKIILIYILLVILFISLIILI